MEATKEKTPIDSIHTSECNRNECTAIFATHTRMLGVKNNYQSTLIDLKSRW